MAIVSVVELPREFDGEVGKPPIARRRWVCNLSGNTHLAPMKDPDYIRATASPDLVWGKEHPTWTWLRLRKVTASENYENDPYKALVTAEYGVIRDEEIIEPRLRPSVWSSEAGSAEVPVFGYYPNAGNAGLLPLTNSAYDYYQGLTTSEAMIRFRVVKNYGPDATQQNQINTFFPYTQLNLINHLNNANYGGGNPHTFKCAGVSVSLNYETLGAVTYKYWQMSAELMYRQTGWNLQLPDVGYNFISGGEKRRAMVFDFQNSEWIASPNPVGLNGFGAQTGGAPAILVRRVLPEADFTEVFGAMPA